MVSDQMSQILNLGFTELKVFFRYFVSPFLLVPEGGGDCF